VGLGDALDGRTRMDSNSDSHRGSSCNEVHQIVKWRKLQVSCRNDSGIREMT